MENVTKDTKKYHELKHIKVEVPITTSTTHIKAYIISGSLDVAVKEAINFVFYYPTCRLILETKDGYPIYVHPNDNVESVLHEYYKEINEARKNNPKYIRSGTEL